MCVHVHVVYTHSHTHTHTIDVFCAKWWVSLIGRSPFSYSLTLTHAHTLLLKSVRVARTPASLPLSISFSTASIRVYHWPWKRAGSHKESIKWDQGKETPRDGVSLLIIIPPFLLRPSTKTSRTHLISDQLYSLQSITRDSGTNGCGGAGWSSHDYHDAICYHGNNTTVYIGYAW